MTLHKRTTSTVFNARLHSPLAALVPCLAGCCALQAARHRIRPCGPLVISAPPRLRVLPPACPRRRSSCAASCGRTGPGRGWRGGRALPPGSWAASPASPASRAAVQMQMGCPARAATRATAAAAAALQPAPQSPPLPAAAAVRSRCLGGARRRSDASASRATWLRLTSGAGARPRVACARPPRAWRSTRPGTPPATLGRRVSLRIRLGLGLDLGLGIRVRLG